MRRDTFDAPDTAYLSIVYLCQNGSAPSRYATFFRIVMALDITRVGLLDSTFINQVHRIPAVDATRSERWVGVSRGKKSGLLMPGTASHPDRTVCGSYVVLNPDGLFGRSTSSKPSKEFHFVVAITL